MALFSKHDVVGYAYWDGLWKDDGVYEEGIKRTTATDIEIEIHASVVMQDEVADCVCSLNWIIVSVERIQEPRIMMSDEVP